jgi:hypothetical protein
VLGNLLAWTAFQGNAINVGVIMSATHSLANLVWTVWYQKPHAPSLPQVGEKAWKENSEGKTHHCPAICHGLSGRKDSDIQYLLGPSELLKSN